jgi:hypothetical protein
MRAVWLFGTGKKCLFVCCVLIMVYGVDALAQQSSFYWLNRQDDPQTFEQITAAFSDELKPDDPIKAGNVVPVMVKYIDRIGQFADTALVVLGYKANTSDPYPSFQAFNFDLRSKSKSPILHNITKSGLLDMWKPTTVAHFENNQNPDVVFEYFSCTECEAEELLGSFRYNENSRSWEFRGWGTQDGDALLIGSDHQFEDDGTHIFECLHAIRDFDNDHLDDIAIRCKEMLEAEEGIPRTVKDKTLFYTFRGGSLHRMEWNSEKSPRKDIQDALCHDAAKNVLCPTR